MLSDIESGFINIDCIAVYDSSRFSRNEASRHNAETLLQKNVVVLFPYFDTTPEDVDNAFIQKSINGLFNESFSRKTSKRSLLKLNDIATQ